MNRIVVDKISHLEQLCRKYCVKTMYVFGSAVTGAFDSGSDIDFLIDFATELNAEEYADNYFDLHYELRALFGREIDLVTENSLSNPYFIESVERTKELIYAA